MKYQNTSKASGITKFYEGAKWIRLEFNGARTYEYHADKIGQYTIDKMKRLAHAGNGLNKFINQYPAIRNSAVNI